VLTLYPLCTTAEDLGTESDGNLARQTRKHIAAEFKRAIERQTLANISRTSNFADDLSGRDSVLDVISKRRAIGSQPGRREDSHYVVLAIEGGASRAVFAGGMALALDDLGLVPCFDAVYGSSAGAWIGAWLLSGSARIALDPDSWDIRTMRLASKPERIVFGHPVVDTERVMDVWRDLVPNFFNTLFLHPISLHPLATNVVTGESVDLAPYISDEDMLRLALRATAAMPALTGPPVKLCGHEWLDGGIVEDVPLATPIRDGATHLLLLRNRRAEKRPSSSSWKKSLFVRLEGAIVRRYLDRHAPALTPIFDDRRQRRAAREGVLKEVAAFGGNCQIRQLRPPQDSPDVSFMQRDIGLLREAGTIGRAVAHAAFSDSQDDRCNVQ
jgi:predicted acylesterase/phospholipase RssA